MLNVTGLAKRCGLSRTTLLDETRSSCTFLGRRSVRFGNGAGRENEDRRNRKVEFRRRKAGDGR